MRMQTERGDVVQYLLNQCARRPLLTAKQEILLSRDIRKWMDSENPDARTIRRGQRAKQKLIEANMRLAVHNAKKYTKRIRRSSNLSLEDLIQEAFIGLNRAAELFDPERGYKFSTYGTMWIKQRIRREIEINSNTIRVANNAVQLFMRYRYKPENMTLEEFAESEGKTVEYVKQHLSNHYRAQTCSLDEFINSGDHDETSRMDFVSGGVADDDEAEYADILHQLEQIPECADSLAALSLSQESSVSDMALVLNCNRMRVRKELENHAAIIREHFPADLRERLQGKEQNPCVKIEKPIPAPAKELALVSCCSASHQSMPEVISQNGQKQVDTDALERLVDDIQAEPVAKPPAKRRVRRTREEIAAERDSEAVSLAINGVSYEGSPQAIAAVLKAMAA